MKTVCRLIQKHQEFESIEDKSKIQKVKETDNDAGLYSEWDQS